MALLISKDAINYYTVPNMNGTITYNTNNFNVSLGNAIYHFSAEGDRDLDTKERFYVKSKSGRVFICEVGFKEIKDFYISDTYETFYAGMRPFNIYDDSGNSVGKYLYTDDGFSGNSAVKYSTSTSTSQLPQRIDVYFGYGTIYLRRASSDEYVEYKGFLSLIMRTTKTSTYPPTEETALFGCSFCILHNNEISDTYLPDFDDSELDFPDDYEPNPDNELGGNSSEDGGNGDFDDESEDIEKPTIPSILLGYLGIMKIYKLTSSQLLTFTSWLFNPDTLEKISRLLSEPMDYLISLEYYPLNITGNSSTIMYGGTDSEISAYIVNNNFISLNFGDLEINEYWGGFLDYAPNTKIELYLPYHGNVTLDTDEVMDSVLSLEYLIDIFTGIAVININVNKKNSELNSNLYTFNCDIASRFPLTAQNYNSYISSIVGAVASTVGMGVMTVSSGGSAIPFVGTALSSGGSVVASSKPNVQKTGIIGGNSGMLGVQTPYITITRPIQQRPQGYSDLVGYTSEIFSEFVNLSGYSVIKDVQLKNINATENEKSKIEMMLKGGVVF